MRSPVIRTGAGIYGDISNAVFDVTRNTPRILSSTSQAKDRAPGRTQVFCIPGTGP
jgi:hypothetical protein